MVTLHMNKGGVHGVNAIRYIKVGKGVVMEGVSAILTRPVIKEEKKYRHFVNFCGQT